LEGIQTIHKEMNSSLFETAKLLAEEKTHRWTTYYRKNGEFQVFHVLYSGSKPL